MTSLIQKLHMYIGLLNFSDLIVFGIAGLAATFHAGPERKPAWEAVRYENFTHAPARATNRLRTRCLNNFIFQPIPNWAIHRDAGNLPLDFYSVNGVSKLTYLWREYRLRL